MVLFSTVLLVTKMNETTELNKLQKPQVGFKILGKMLKENSLVAKTVFKLSSNQRFQGLHFSVNGETVEHEMFKTVTKNVITL